MEADFTPALQFAWNRAGRIAAGEGRSDIDPLDLVRGLLIETEGHAVRRLSDAGFILADWQARFAEDAARAAGSDVTTMPAAASLRLVMARARHEVGDLTDEGSLSTDQVLTALVAVAGSVRQALEECGLDDARFRAAGQQDTTPLTLDEPLDLGEPSDRHGAARIVDAAANRAREALRVLEDHCRFVLDDPLLSMQCKELRHELAQALQELPAGDLLSARDTAHDVGTSLATEGERQRGSLDAVLQANAKRLQEALRSLEEFGKVLAPELGARIERLRYRSYEIERALVLGRGARVQLADSRLCVLVSEACCRTSLVGTVRELLEGGVDMIQLREKELDDRALLDRARTIRQLTHRLGALFIVNDRPDIAILSEADGVHLGQDDVPIHEARKLVGPRLLIGVSTHDVTQARQAVLDGANYIGVGPTFASNTKNFVNFAGLGYVEQVSRMTSLPAYAIGGITLDLIDQVLAAGARRIAVSQALCSAEQPRLGAALFRKKLDAVAKET